MFMAILERQCYRDEPTLNNAGTIVDFADDNAGVSLNLKKK